VRATSVPVLLIHGAADGNIPIRHSRRLHAANPRTTVLWEVPDGGHVNAIDVARAEYTARVLDWFASH
jgi:pimeloyl-ACP methyl ester carboxylesterase